MHEYMKVHGDLFLQNMGGISTKPETSRTICVHSTICVCGEFNDFVSDRH